MIRTPGRTAGDSHLIESFFAAIAAAIAAAADAAEFNEISWATENWLLRSGGQEGLFRIEGGQALIKGGNRACCPRVVVVGIQWVIIIWVIVEGVVPSILISSLILINSSLIMIMVMVITLVSKINEIVSQVVVLVLLSLEAVTRLTTGRGEKPASSRSSRLSSGETGEVVARGIGHQS